MVILCASGGMALGSWIGGALYDVTGSYSLAFIIGVGFNISNLVIIGHLIHRNTRQSGCLGYCIAMKFIITTCGDLIVVRGTPALYHYILQLCVFACLQR